MAQGTEFRFTITSQMKYYTKKSAERKREAGYFKSTTFKKKKK